MKINYKYYNANPHKEDCNDCTVRALSKFLNIEWEEAYTKLFKKSLKLKVHFNYSGVVRTLLKDMGYIEEEGGVKVKDFIVEDKKDYIIWAKLKKKKQTLEHLICVKDNTIFDSFNPKDYKTILYWVKDSE